jgi:hypothetical protein
MKRRSFFKSAAMAGLAASTTVKKSSAYLVAHNWDKYDFGAGPTIRDRLNQGPFPQYPPEALFPSSDVVMTTLPSLEAVPNYGRGLITYLAADSGLSEIVGEDKPKEIEALFQFALGSKVYIRPTWREMQQKPGRLNPPDYWKLTLDLAKKYNKKIGFRIQMRAPDYKEEALPDFVLEKVPMVKLTKGKWNRAGKTEFSEPRYDHPAFQDAYKELNGLMAAELNGSPLIEFMDTFMYGFWGEGHTWPFTDNPFPDYATAERTWLHMLDVQLKAWDKTPLVTNTQPDFSVVGDAEMLDRTVRRHNWVRTDSIFVENMQIEELSNRPPWVAAVLEVGMGAARPAAAGAPANPDAVNPIENTAQHCLDLGGNYVSLWNFHRISAAGLQKTYESAPKALDELNRRVGYNVRPSYVWKWGEKGSGGLVIGLINDGVAGVPGVLRISAVSDDGKINVGGGVDAGCPVPGKIRQAMLPLPEGVNWEGLKLKAEIEVKGVRYPVRWSCRQKTNPDGSLTLRRNQRG